MPHSRQHALIERSLKIGAYAGAPLSSNSVLQDLGELDSNDITLEMFLDELKLYLKLTEGGLRTFLEGFDESMRHMPTKELMSPSENSSSDASPQAPIEDEDVPILPTGKTGNTPKTHLGVLTYLFPFYIHRISKLGEHLARMRRRQQAEIYMKTTSGRDIPTELVDDLRRLKQMVANGNRPKDIDPSVFDMTDGIQWDIPDLRYPSSVSTIPSTPSTAGKSIRWKMSIQDQGKPSQETPMRGFSNRCQQRHPTGFAKFNLSQLKELDLDDDDDGNGVKFSLRSGASSQRSSGNQRDFGEESEKDSMRIRSQHSSFDESPPHVIEDDQADPNWKDDKRSQVRQRRVRQRIPTGHPNMMKNAVLARMSLDNDCEITKYNTEINGGGNL